MKPRPSSRSRALGTRTRLFLLATLPAASLASASGTDTLLVSQSSLGQQGNAGSGRASLSADGLRVAFKSFASDLVPGDGNSRADVFLRDLQSDQTTLVSLGQGGVQGNQDVIDLFLSQDGSTLAWTTSSNNLVALDSNGARDVFVRELATGIVTRVSVSTSGMQANFHCSDPCLSADGRIVAFTSSSTNLVAGDTNNAADIFVHDRATGVTVLASQSTLGVLGLGNSGEASLSADGSLLAFSSAAPNLVPGDSNGASDCFLRDLVAGTTTRISVAPGGIEGDAGSRFPRLTPDGAWIAFESRASNFDPLDTNDRDDVYLLERQSGALERISVDAAGTSSAGACSQPSVSADARYISFGVELDDLDAQDTSGTSDIYRKDRLTRALLRVSLGPGGQQDDIGSGRSTISADGSRITFYTNATTFLSPDLNGFEADVYLARCLPPGMTSCASTPNSTGATAALEAQGSASLSVSLLTLLAFPLPDQAFLFFCGPSQLDLPFGNGRLCVGGPQVRLGSPRLATGQLASLSFAPIAAGLTVGSRYFQCWFRDPAAGGAAFDTSDAYAITFVP